MAPLQASLANTSLQDWLFNQGVLGVALVLAIIVIMRLWKKLEDRDAEIAALNRDRLADAKYFGTRMQRMARAQQRLIRGDEDDADDDDDADSSPTAAARLASSPELRRS